MRVWALIAVLICCTGLGFGQAPTSAQIKELQDLQSTIKELETRLAALKAEMASVPSVPATAPPEPDAQPKPIAVQEVAVEGGDETELPVDLSGYLSLRYMDDNSSSGVGSFQSNALSLFLGKQLGRWRYFSEVEFEYAPNYVGSGSATSTARGEILTETVWLSYTKSDALTFTAGQLLVPAYWRVHHYPSTTLTVQNPLIDKRIFPADIVGGMVGGSAYFDFGGLEYGAYLGNGRGSDPGKKDVDDHKATGARFVYHAPSKGRMRALELGTHWYHDKVSATDREHIIGFESRFEAGRYSFLGEYARANIGAPGRPRTMFREGLYLQPSVRLGNRTYGFYRFDRLNFDNRVAHANDAVRHSLGTTFRPRPAVSLKLELYRTLPENRATSRTDGVAAGLAVFFK